MPRRRDGLLALPLLFLTGVAWKWGMVEEARRQRRLRARPVDGPAEVLPETAPART
jgi:hypothetical protein